MRRYYYMGGRIPLKLYLRISAGDFSFKETLFVKDDTEVKKGVCRICGCTMEDPCSHYLYGTCSWADDDETICSWCAEGVLSSAEKKEVIHRCNTCLRVEQGQAKSENGKSL